MQLLFPKRFESTVQKLPRDIWDILTMPVIVESTAGIRMCVARKYKEDNNIFYSSINHKPNIIDHRIKYIEKR